MRKLNVVFVLIIFILLLDHIIFGSLHLLGMNVRVTKQFALAMLLFVLLHGLLSMLITIP